jgi:hypothetical protein
MNVYFDESIHAEAGFIVGAFVFCDTDPNQSIANSLLSVGLTNFNDEFKSGARMVANAPLAQLRDQLLEQLFATKIALIVIPSVRREELGDEALGFYLQILENNGLADQSHSLYLDEGIPISQSNLELAIVKMNSKSLILLNQKSHVIRGIQLADLAAHSCAVMLKQHLSADKKLVAAGENSGYEPNLMIDLEFKLWAQMRYQFFKAPLAQEATVDDPVGNYTYDVTGYGLYVSSHCSEGLTAAALERFGDCYMGCIH